MTTCKANLIKCGIFFFRKARMKDAEELIRRYGLEEDPEHIIIPFRDKDGRQKRRYLLKRRFIRIVYTEGYFVDYPIADVIRATVRYPELLLSEALYRMYGESD
jgi:hypothetical protein